jgi:hypothetical protein
LTAFFASDRKLQELLGVEGGLSASKEQRHRSGRNCLLAQKYYTKQGGRNCVVEIFRVRLSIQIKKTSSSPYHD